MEFENYLKEKHYGKFKDKKVTIRSKEIHQQIVQAVKNKISSEREIDIRNLEEAKIVNQSALRWIDEEVEDNFSTELLSIQDKYEIFEQLVQNMFGYGVIEPLLNDESVTEVMINGLDKIFYEQEGKIYRAKDKRGRYLSFTTAEELKNIVNKIVAPINRKVDESNPVVDARLPDGSRVNIVLNPIALDGTSVTIRKFPENPYTMEQLLEFGSINKEVYDVLIKLVACRYNIIVSGGTGSGKTTFLNALSMFIPTKERVLTIEDSAELKFNQVENIVRLETRMANIEGKGEINIRALVRTALRMRPDRIIVGEIRSGEAIDMLQAMNTGHDGSLSTGHANSAEDMLLRLETMVLMSGMELPISAIRSQIASAVDIIIHTGKLRDGSRRVLQISEVQDYINGEVVVKDLYRFKETEETDNGKIIGELLRTRHNMVKLNKFITAGHKEMSQRMEVV